MARAPKKPLPVDLGTIRKPLERPEKAADLTHAQVTELKERRRLLESYETQANDIIKVVQLLRSEYQKTAQTLIEQSGLSRDDDYNIDTDGGVIWRTATYVPLEPETISEEVVEEEAVAATNGKKG